MCSNDTVIDLSVAYGIGISSKPAASSPSTCVWVLAPSKGPVIYQLTMSINSLSLVGSDELVVYSVVNNAGDRVEVGRWKSGDEVMAPVVVYGNTTTYRAAMAVVELVRGVSSGAGSEFSVFQMSVAPGQCVAGMDVTFRHPYGSFTDGTVSSVNAPLSSASHSCGFRIQSTGPVVVRAVRVSLSSSCSSNAYFRDYAVNSDGSLGSYVSLSGSGTTVTTESVAGIHFYPGLSCSYVRSGFELMYGSPQRPGMCVCVCACV